MKKSFQFLSLLVVVGLMCACSSKEQSIKLEEQPKAIKSDALQAILKNGVGSIEDVQLLIDNNIPPLNQLTPKQQEQLKQSLVFDTSTNELRGTHLVEGFEIDFTLMDEILSLLIAKKITTRNRK